MVVPLVNVSERRLEEDASEPATIRTGGDTLEREIEKARGRGAERWEIEKERVK